MKLTERQLYMLRDVASFDHARYRYRAMPQIEISVRDSRVMLSLMRKGMIEYPHGIEMDGMPYVCFEGIRITESGKRFLAEIRNEK